MRSPVPYTILVLAALAPAAATGQAALSFERTAGLGLKPQSAEALITGHAFGEAAVRAWQGLPAGDYALYGGAHDAPRLGLRTAESHAGIVHSASGWGTSFEAAYSNLSPVAPGRHAFTGQLHTSLSEGRTLSVGLKYRLYDSDIGSRYGMPGEMTPVNGYTLSGPRPAGYAPSYQVQMSYQHSAASAFGLALGRDVETFTPLADLSGSGPRQFSFTGQHWLTPSWALSYDILSHDVASPLKLQGLRLGVRYRW
jgi:hypothetical protein